MPLARVKNLQAKEWNASKRDDMHAACHMFSPKLRKASPDEVMPTEIYSDSQKVLSSSPQTT